MDDRERAFKEWLVTGEIPDWRKGQLTDEAVREAMGELVTDTLRFRRVGDLMDRLKEEIDEVELDARTPARILVTTLIPDGDPNFYDLPLPDPDDPLKDTGKRQLLCAPATWERLKAMTPAAMKAMTPAGEEAEAVFGIPVVIEQ